MRLARLFQSGAVRVGVLVAVILAGTGIAVATRSTPPSYGAGWLEARPLELADEFFLFDVGATDVDGDGHLDLYTTNHNGRQSLRLGNGSMAFDEDSLSALGLDQDPTIPGSEAEGAPPDRAGLALYRLRNDLMLRFRPGPATPTSVTLRFFAAVDGEVDDGEAELSTEASEDAEGRAITTVRVTTPGAAVVRLSPELRGLPLDVELPAGASRVTTFGPDGFLVPADDFTVRLLDRHAMAWSDVDADGLTDVFTARGGLKDRIDEFPDLVEDELALATGAGTFEPVGDTGLQKGECRGRRATWVDVDGDDDLDLHVTCAGDPPQLWRRDEGLRFSDVSATLAIEGLSTDAFVWHDLDGDRVPELVTALGVDIAVLRRGDQGTYEVAQTLDLGLPRGLAEAHLGDLDGDGDGDVLFASPAGSMIAWNRDGTFAAQPAEEVGLPAKAIAARLVDVDGDGRLDIHVMPDGVWRQDASGRFESTAIAVDLVPDDATNARATWFDADDDGDRDLVVAWTSRGDKDWTVALLERVGEPETGVSLDLVGPPGNREAVGAVVDVEAAETAERRWVGESEGARFSDGHRRVYLSTGREQAATITVTWPDGSTQRVQDAGRLVRVVHPDAVGAG